MLTERQLCIEWVTETEYCHHGMPLSNGVFGALVWFRPQTVCLTVNRADYWDHRGGTEWTPDCNFANIRRLLEAGDFDGVRRMFSKGEYNGQLIRPTRLPMGRFELELRDGVTVAGAELDLYRPEARIRLRDGEREGMMRVAILMEAPVLVAEADESWITSLREVPANEFPDVADYYTRLGFPDEVRVRDDGAIGWVQALPADPSCAVLAKLDANDLRIAAEYGTDNREAVAHAFETLRRTDGIGYERLVDGTRAEWAKLWSRTAAVNLADRELEIVYALGIYKMLGNSMPGRIAPTLQGPWAEEHRMVLWSGDYHFNINVQECLWPAYAANLTDCLLPLFRMLDGWKEKLAQNAKTFVGIDDGYQLNHATDDRGQCMGGFWTGAIDHANTSWVAQLMWPYYRYTLDEAFLLEQAYPFMKRAMNVFLRMMEERDGRLVLPVTVSPEYGGAGDRAWGRNSSFFLANVHFLCETIVQIAERYGLDADYAERLREVRAKLPLYTTGPGPHGEEIYLWEGQRLEESHRHHSHLAGIYPFDVIDLEDEQNRRIVENTYKSWVAEGMGKWTGWAMPWASILHARLDRADMALFCLRILREVFMMPGYATRHNASFEGFTTFAGGDIMQVEASIAASAAILEWFVQTRRGVLHVFPAVSARFRDVSCRNVRAEGAFLVSAERRDGRLCWVEIASERGGRLRLRNPFTDGGDVKVRAAMGERSWEWQGELLELDMKPRETLRLETI